MTAERTPEQVIVIGATGLMQQCLRIAGKLAGDVPVEGVDTARTAKADVMARLLAVTRPTLVLSIANSYLFPADVVRHPPLTIVNLHRGLLPGHRGRNVSAWAIYFDEKENGVTWHLVDEGVDTGRIIRTVTVPIRPDDTAFTLMRRQHAAAAESFQSLFPLLLRGEIPSEEPADRPSDLHLSREVPNGGLLDPDWSGRKISCFLRCMDYGILHVLGTPRVRFGGAEWAVRRYAIAEEPGRPDGEERGEGRLTLWRDGLRFELTVEPAAQAE